MFMTFSSRLAIASKKMSGLSAKLREAFLMVEVLGLTYRETAAALAIPEGTAKTRVHLARRHLAAVLADAEEGHADEV